MTNVVAQNLTKTYRVGEIEVHALRGVDLKIEAGEFVAIVGPSGSGKSTLFNILGGLTPPTSGTVLIDGRPHPDERSGSDVAAQTTVGFVFQKYNLLPTLTGGDNIEIARHIAGKNGRERDPQFEETLKLLGIESRLNHKPRALSGGEQQRIAIARAIVNHPAILLADEPTGNLDTENSKAVLSVLQGLNKRLGQTILIITHNPEAAAYADRIVTMRDGRIVD
jgi:putative ABC transport system ATP-binding protein